MKKIAMLSLVAILNVSCNAQDHKKEDKNPQKKEESISQITEPPKGKWKVDKEFDENGNLIRYDSIYSWSSTDGFGELSSLEKDSTLQSMQSKFYRNFSRFGSQGFDDIFSQDSLFTDRFFDDDFFTSEFGADFMDIEKIHKRMENMQKRFLEKYRSEFNEPESVDPKDDN